MGINLREEDQSKKDERTVREALKFFFSSEGNVIREFLLEEIVTFVDSSGREATQELISRLGLSNLPQPSLFKAINPALSPEDKRNVQQMRKLASFLVGDFDASFDSARIRQLLPVLRGYRSEIREFATLLAVRLSEKAVSRGLNWATSLLAV